MSTAKEEVRKMLDELPEGVSYEDIQYHLYVRQKIERALEDAKRGERFTHKEVEQHVAKWLAE